MTRVLIVDDDEDILFAGRMVLKNHVDKVITLNRPDSIPDIFSQQSIDVVLLDMNFSPHETSGRDGLVWLERIISLDPDAVVILITGYSDANTAVEGMKRGAADYLEKPWVNERLVATVKAALALREARNENVSLKKKTTAMTQEVRGLETPMLGQSKAMDRIRDMITKAAPTDANVLILGENGTGKELVAREIYRKSKRSGDVFLSVDLGAISETLFESELFGHKKGAFTDAREDRIGRFEAASGGTIFLDEIGNIPLNLQAKLLTVLERREVTAIGHNRPVSIDVRVISATNITADHLHDESRFRQDLLYRLNTVEIHLPPLRERREDIPLLAEAFLAEFSNKYHKNGLSFSDQAMDAMKRYAWPGNIRAMRHSIERAVILCEGPMIGQGDLGLQTDTPLSLSTEGKTLEDIERTAIGAAIEKHDGNVSKAAKELGLTRASLYRRLEKHGL